jgi:transposase
MSTSLLYHAFGLQHQEYLGTEYVDGKIIFKIRTKPEELRCSNCNSYKVKLRGSKERIFRAQPIGKKRIYLRAKIQRLECKECGVVRQEAIKYADYKKSYTKGFQRYVLELSKMMTIQDVSNAVGAGWDLVKGIQKEYLQKHYGKPDLKGLKRIAIDEIAIQKGHKYFTVVMDLDSGAIVFVGEGKDSACLLPFWKRLKRSGAKIESVSIDMSPAYIEAVAENLSVSEIVFDHFHIIKMYNDKLTEIRRDLYNFETESSKKNY